MGKKYIARSSKNFKFKFQFEAEKEEHIFNSLVSKIMRNPDIKISGFWIFVNERKRFNNGETYIFDTWEVLKAAHRIK